MNFENKEIKSITPYNIDGVWYANIKIKSEDSKCVYEIEIPQVQLFNDIDCISVESYFDKYFNSHPTAKIISDDNEFIIVRQLDGSLFYTRVIKNKTKKMTIDEIEKELGYKIEIINK